MAALHFGGKVQQVAERGVGGGKGMAMHRQRPAFVVAPGREVGGRHQRHVAAAAVGLGLLRIVEAGHAVAGNAAQQKRIVVVLAAQPAIAVHRLRQVDFVAAAAEGGGLVQRLQERAFVQRRLGFDQGTVDPAQRRMVRVGEGIAGRNPNQIVRIAAHAHRFDGVARHAADAGLGGGIAYIVEVRVVETAAEQRRRVVTAGAEARCLHMAVPGQHLGAGLAHGERVCGIVERGEAVGAVLPPGMGIGMAAGALGVPQQVFRRDVAAGRRAGQGWREGRRRRWRCLRRGPVEARCAKRQRQAADASANAPADGAARQPVQHEQPSRQQRRGHMGPVRGGARQRVPQFHHRQAAGEGDAGTQQHDHGGEQAKAKPHSQPIRPAEGAAQVQRPVHQRRQHDDEPQCQMRQEHHLIGGILQILAEPPLPGADGA